MALVLNEKYPVGRYFLFIQQRYLRLFPLYLVITLFSVVSEGLVSWLTARPVGVYQYWTTTGHLLPAGLWAGIIFSNIFILGQDIWSLFGFAPGAGSLYPASLYPLQCPLSPIPQGLAYVQLKDMFAIVPAWTLGIELLFYAVAPLLVRCKLSVQLFIVLATVVFRLLCFKLGWLLYTAPWTDRFFPFELCYFMAGSISYYIYGTQKAAIAGFLHRHRKGFARFLIAALIVLLIFNRLPGVYIYRFFILTLVLTALIPFLFAFTKDNERDRLIGELSYPVYLCHFTLIALLQTAVSSFPKFLQGGLYAAIAIGFAWLCYRAIEIRVDHYRHKLFQKRIAQKT
jgi:peptidoglycan/LPS O-acetylase OafA/YrhL